MSPLFHEYIPGSTNSAAKYFKHYLKSQNCLKYTQTFWCKLVSILMSRRKVCCSSSDFHKAPITRFMEFVHMIATKNANKNIEDQLAGQQNYFTGLNNSSMLINLFSIVASQLD